MKNVLIVIDMQNDFIDGALGSKEAGLALDHVQKAIQDRQYDTVFATMDTHAADYLRTQEGKELPVEHCLRGTAGWQISGSIAKALQERHAVIIEKPSFASVKLAEMLAAGKPESITLCGVCTDICVISNAILLKAWIPEVPIKVLADACAATEPSMQEAALKVLRSCQIHIC